MSIRPEDALEYHSSSPAGKVSVTPTKPCQTQRDLSLAYTPGVAVPCLEIERDPSLAYKYTAKANLVAVVSNGTAVLGLGNIGAIAGKPVIEGKGVLFKRFADIDVFDIELDTANPDEIIRTCQILEPTFGGINLEDIKAPECFYIEETLRRTMKIPVFHDDQHGTAIISAAGLLNALDLVGKRIEDIKVVFNGAGAAAISCAAHYCNLGVRRENIVMCDTKGVIYEGRTSGMNPYKARYASNTAARTLAALAKEDVPDSVLRAYGVDRVEFGREYIIPKPFDPRVLIWEASAVAKAAMETGVAQAPVDLGQYAEELQKRLGAANMVMRGMINKAKKEPKRIVFTEGEESKILRACQILIDEKIAVPILRGRDQQSRAHAAELRLPLGGLQLGDPAHFPTRP